MKVVCAYIPEHKLSQITMELIKISGFPGMTIIDCYGFGREHTELSQDYKSFLPRKRLEIFAPDSLVDVIFDTIILKKSLEISFII
jgi:nitrogen regulatory protein PII